jgi:hypothetical protein
MPEPSGSPTRTRPPTPEPDPPTPPEEEAQAPAPGSPADKPPSVLDRLKEQHAEATEDRRTTIQIAPGRFDGNLAALYHPIPWTDTRKSARKAQRGGLNEEAELNYGAGQLAKACEQILVRVEDGGELIPLHEAVDEFKDGGPVRYDARLCKALGIEVTPGLSPAAVVRLVFKHAHALNDHYTQFDLWLKESMEGDEEDEEGLTERPT